MSERRATVWSAPAAVSRWVAELVRDESRAGVFLLAGTLVALVWSNVGEGAYRSVWTSPLHAHLGVFELPQSPLALVNDGAMSIFFLVIGVELARALRFGELSSRASALLPVAAAIGGMAGAAAAYVAVSRSGIALHGYGIPTATDVAFSLGALSLFGRRVPASLRAFVLALAIADDLGSLALLVVGYSTHLELARCGIALGAGVVLLVLRRAHVRGVLPYLAVGLWLWEALVGSGIEPALAGVAVGLTYPGGEEPIDLEHVLRLIANTAVIPIFAVANVGVVLRAGLFTGSSLRVVLAVVVARLVGKTVGLVGATVLASRALRVELPGGRPLVLLGAALCCGVGFTVPLLIAGLAFSGEPSLLAGTRAALVLASLVALGLAAVAFARASGRPASGR